MRILLVFYSKTGANEALAERLTAELTERGHVVATERLRAAVRQPHWWSLVLRCLPGVPRLLCSAFVWPQTQFKQAEMDLQPLRYPDVAGFDRLVVGGPKWMHLSFPLARYLRVVRGLDELPVAAFSAFCGPAAWYGFELYPYFHPLNQRVRDGGGKVIAQLALSTARTEVAFMPAWVFRTLSWLVFLRPLASFCLGSSWANQRIEVFCNRVEKGVVDQHSLLVP